MVKDSIQNKAIILLKDGTIFFGKALGVKGTSFGELCFNTGMTGYQEIFTDPSYYGQLMVTTNAHIGNYGVNDDEVESKSPKIAGLICKNFNSNFSRPAAKNSLQDFFIKHKIVAISDVDTRALVSYIRDNGAMNAVISTDTNSIDDLKKQLKSFPSMKGLELASKVSTDKPYFYGNPDSKFKIAALDLGIKENILRNFSKRDVYIKVFPYNSTFEEIKDEINSNIISIEDGPIFSNLSFIEGCTDPLACNYNIEANIDDSSCINKISVACDQCSGEQDGTGTLFQFDLDGDGVCDEDEILGCTDNGTEINGFGQVNDLDGDEFAAINFNPEATS